MSTANRRCDAQERTMHLTFLYIFTIGRLRKTGQLLQMQRDHRRGTLALAACGDLLAQNPLTFTGMAVGNAHPEPPAATSSKVPLLCLNRRKCSDSSATRRASPGKDGLISGSGPGPTPGSYQRSRTSTDDFEREQQTAIRVFSAFSVTVRTMSRWSGLPSSTRVRHVPQTPLRQDVSMS